MVYQPSHSLQEEKLITLLIIAVPRHHSETWRCQNPRSVSTPSYKAMQRVDPSQWDAQSHTNQCGLSTTPLSGTQGSHLITVSRKPDRETSPPSTRVSARSQPMPWLSVHFKVETFKVKEENKKTYCIYCSLSGGFCRGKQFEAA